MKLLLTCVLAIAVALAALTVAFGYFRQSRNLQAQLTATTKELQQTKSDLERGNAFGFVSHQGSLLFVQAFGPFTWPYARHLHRPAAQKGDGTMRSSLWPNHTL